MATDLSGEMPSASEATPGVPAATPARARAARFDQYKRTWYFLRRNTLALFGLGVILAIVGVAVYAASTPIPWDQMPLCEGSNNQVVSFHETGLPAHTLWSVSIEGVTISSTTPYVNFSLGSGPAYPYSIGTVTGYTSVPSTGTVNVAGVPTTVNVKFTAGGAAAPGTTSSGGANPAGSSAVLACNICTYPAGTPPPGPNCYQTPKNAPSVIAPTASFSGLGPLPLGALTVQPGTQYFYNIYNGLLRGSDYTLIVSFSIVVVGAMLGLIIGAISGFWGGVIDEAIMRLVDIFLSIPQILFVIIVVSVVITTYHTVFGLSALDSRIFLLITAFMVVWWPFYARIVRSQVLVVREQKYVEAARASGASKRRIVFKHIIPNSMYPVFIQMSLDVGTIPLLTGFLVFLGFQIWPVIYFPEWGTISALATSDIVSGYLGLCSSGPCTLPWWQLFFPGLAIFLFAISVNFLSDGIRDALDPRLRR
jgi:peptide/nickel transport system permease protein